MTAEPTATPPTSPSGRREPPREKTGIPKNPGRRDLGMKVTLLFPDREIVEKFYVPIIYTACRTCYSEAGARGDLPAGGRGRLRPGQDAEAHLRRSSSPATARPSSTSSSRSRSAACRGRSRTSSSATGPASRSTSRASATSSSRAPATMLPHSIAEGDPDLRERYEEQVDGVARALRRPARGRAARARTPGSSSRTRPARTS